MRIALDAKRALNNATGLGNHARILLHALMRDFPEQEYLLFSPKAKDEFFHQLTGDFKLFFPNGKFHQIFHSAWRSFGIKEDLRREQPTIYHGLSNELPFGIRDLKIKSVVTIHDLIFVKHTEQYPWIDRQIYEIKTRYAAKHAHKIIAVSRETKRDLIEMYGVEENKIEVIYPGVATDFQQEKNPIPNKETLQKYKLPPKYILNVGSFFPRKNQKTLIESFDLVHDEIEEDLVLVGNGVLHQEITELIHKKDLQKRIHVVTTIRNEDLPEVYRAAHLFVFPSLFEGFGAPVLEALFSKVPVIASKGGAIEEAAGSHSLFVDPLSPEDLADTILQVLKNTALRNEMISEGYAHAQTMNDKVFAAKTMAVYESL